MRLVNNLIISSVYSDTKHSDYWTWQLCETCLFACFLPFFTLVSVYHFYLNIKKFIAGTLFHNTFCTFTHIARLSSLQVLYPDSPTYLGRLREAQNFWSDKCIPKIPKMYLTKPNQFVSKLIKLIIFSKYHNTSEGLNICTVPWISFLH